VRRVLAALAALAAVLATAFVVAPSALAGIGSGGGFADQRHLTAAVRAAFVEYWRSGDRDLSPGLASVVDYWFRYHLAKALIAASLLIVVVALGVLLWRVFLRAGGLGTAAAGVAVTMLALFALLVLMANIQGVVAPFASLLPMLGDGAQDGELAGTLTQVRQRLADPQRTPAAEAMVSDFARYHVAMAVIATIVAVVLIGLSVLLWKRFASDRRARWVSGSYGVLSALLSLAMVVLAVANATTAADPAPALLALFNGSW